MRLFLWLVFLLISLPATAQFGIRLSYELNQKTNWQNLLDNIPLSTAHLFDQSQTATLDYWFRLKNVRIEILPEISYTRFRDKSTFLGLESSYTMNVFGAGLGAHLYPFDFFGDCECPTFSKQGNFLQKGFFVLARAGFQHYSQQLTLTGTTYSTSDWGPAFSGGIGVDIGINNLLTISPFIAYKMNPSVRWNDFSENHGFTDIPTDQETTVIQQWQLGVRLGFRPDYQE